MSDSTTFQEAKEAIRQGDDERARDLLARLLRKEKNNPEYWLWMSSVVFSLKEKIFCLTKVASLDPNNISAKRGLIMLGGIPAEDIEPSPPLKRDWEIDLGGEELQGWQKIYANPVIRIGGFAILATIVLGLLLGGIFSTRGKGEPQLTITPLAWTPTSTELPTGTPIEPTSTLVFTPTPEPLWMLLDATYTPTPIYVNTPHPRLEAYRLAIRAYSREDYTAMVNFLEQTHADEPEAVDVIYYLGEGYRELEEYDKAFQYYEDALAIDSRFAPAYLARARLRRALNPGVDILSDLDKAIESDPLYSEAYLERAKYWASKGDNDSAIADLEVAIDLNPFDPGVYLEMAKVNLAMGDDEEALENALDAYQKDMTTLESYLVLGEAYLANNLPQRGLTYLNTYGLYRPNDPHYLALLGGAFYKIGEFDSALEVLDQAKTLAPDLAVSFFYHGLTSLEIGDTNQAVNDFYIARNLKPEDLNYSLWFGIALYKDGRFNEAYTQFDLINPDIVSEAQAGQYYYYKAKSGMELSLIDPVKTAWTALLELPEDTVPVEWIKEAEAYLIPPTGTTSATSTQPIINTPTPTRTNTQTPSITSSPRATPSPTASSSGGS